MIKKSKGFTLIELLVVISVISLLASIIFASLNDARAKARDARRKSDIHQFQLALEYYLDTNGIYPASGGASPSPNGPNSSWSNSAEASSWGSGKIGRASCRERG